MDRPPEMKKDEQRPLLKVESVVVESMRPPPEQPQNWSVTCVLRKSWLQRYPEFISATWMSLILLGMSFLVFYALSMATYKRQPLLLKYNDGKPSSHVFLHYIINKGCRLPLEMYSQFLESMVLDYPNLRFNIFFLVDDTIRHPYYIARHGRFPRWLGYPTRDLFMKHSCLKEFERRHSNLNITVMPLNKYMAMTPLRFKWRTIPVAYLTFYARVFSVWQHGGIGMDLTTFNNQFSNNFRFDRRVIEILKNHNDGLPEQDYNVMLQAIDEEEDNYFRCLKQILNDTLSMFNSFFSFGLPSQIEVSASNDSHTTRTQRAKRDAGYNFYDVVKSEDTLNTTKNVMTDVVPNVTIEDTNNIIKESSSNIDLLKNEIPQTTSEWENLNPSEATITAERVPEREPMPVGHNKSVNISEGPQAILIYDFSIKSDKLGHFRLREPAWPTFLLPGFNSKSEAVEDAARQNKTKMAAHLALGTEGLFIATNDKMHPFLGLLMNAGFLKMRPEFAIQDTLVIQCSGPYKNQAYCGIYNL